MIDTDGDHVADAEDGAPNDSNRRVGQLYTSVDLDGDGARIMVSGTEICSDSKLPAGYFNNDAPISYNDCGDDNPKAYRRVVVYEDIDSSGVIEPLDDGNITKSVAQRTARHAIWTHMEI